MKENNCQQLHSNDLDSEELGDLLLQFKFERFFNKLGNRNQLHTSWTTKIYGICWTSLTDKLVSKMYMITQTPSDFNNVIFTLLKKTRPKKWENYQTISLQIWRSTETINLKNWKKSLRKSWMTISLNLKK